MEVEEWNRDTVREVETAWRKRSQGDPLQPAVKPPLEQLVENVKEPVEKPPPHARPLRRSHTDPTDLLWVFRRRASLLKQRVQQNIASSQSNECNEPYRVENDESSSQIKEGLNASAIDKARSSRSESPSSQDSHPKEFTTEDRARESSSDSETRDDTPYEWTAMPVKHHDEPRRKISAPAYRPGRRDSVVAVHANRRASVAAPRRFNRRGSEAPALTVIARRRNSQSLAYPVGLRRRNSRAAGLDNQLRVQAKAKHEMLANLVLPAFIDEPPRTRERRIERRNTFTFQAPSMRTKKDEKRYQVAKEILETEKKYLSCLRTLKEVFEEPMRESNLIPSKEIDVLFPGELVHILTSHTHFMKDLEERLQNWKLQGIVGDIFTKLSGSYHIDVLRIYSNYVNNFPKAIGVINKSSRGSQKFRKFLQNCSSKSECEGLDLPAFLLTPIQRLPRYVLLLRQLSKHTDAGHPDSFHIENALETMKQMINILNDSIQSSCKLANNSQFRRSFKRKSLKKKGKELQKNRQNSQENDRGSVGANSVSALSLDSAGPGNTCSQDGSPERITSQAVILEEKESPTLSRPASIGDKETYYERDTHEEFAAIEEEDSDDVKDNKNSGCVSND
ncbi:rho guanine nucleotide exchange factor 10-like isoform X2 [Orbicella faveolata]|nr:rho guanine nucleotide exchange factor 10-like isoform X2 [Orbicella faveolata]XP_020619625.1 rho guanine nucleotide exchange factor 10-like isoform X2 [Orbicella faveolata]